MKKKNHIDLKLLPKQYEFVASQAREVLYAGALGSGKTRALAIRLALRASVPGACEGLFRKTLVSLRPTVLKALLDGEGGQPAVLPSGSYHHAISGRTITIHHGGQILYGGLDDPGWIRSLNLTGAAVDQAEELDETAWTELRGRIRVSVPGLSNCLYGAANPSAPSHFLAKRFGLSREFPNAMPGCHPIRTRTIDNPFLPQDYINDLLSWSGVARQRLVEGEWVAAEGLVYPFDRTVHVRQRSGPFRRTVIGCDWGFTNPAAVLAVGMDDAGRLHVIDELYTRGMVSTEFVTRARAMAQQHGAESVMVDPSAASVIEEMRRAGLNAIPANNDVRSGIAVVAKRFPADGTGTPGITIAPCCENLIRELEAYQWQGKDKDKPVKCNDHACDALRYAAVRFEDGGSLEVRLLGEYRPRPSTGPRDDSRNERVWHRLG